MKKTQKIKKKHRISLKSKYKTHKIRENILITDDKKEKYPIGIERYITRPFQIFMSLSNSNFNFLGSKPSISKGFRLVACETPLQGCLYGHFPKNPKFHYIMVKYRTAYLNNWRLKFL